MFDRVILSCSIIDKIKCTREQIYATFLVSSCLYVILYSTLNITSVLMYPICSGFEKDFPGVYLYVCMYIYLLTRLKHYFNRR